MRFLIAAFLAAFFAIASAADNPVLHTDALTLVFTPGWKVTQGPHRAEGHGPDGEFLIVSHVTLLPDASADAVEHHWKTVNGFANDKMPGIATSHQNTVHRPLTKTELPDGRVQFSTVSQGKKLFRDYYFLQYLLGSSRSLVYMTVEGYGNAEEAAQRFEQVLATQQWNEQKIQNN